MVGVNSLDIVSCRLIANTPATNDQINECFCNAYVKTKVKRILREISRGMRQGRGARGYDTEWLETQDLSLTRKMPRAYKRLSAIGRERVDNAFKFSVFSECAYGAVVQACGDEVVN